MMLRGTTYFIVALFLSGHTEAAEWDKTPIPADAGEGLEWKIVENVSDDFNYRFSPAGERTEFGGKWVNGYFSHWEGPGTTRWRPENIAVAKGKLWVRATREPGETKNFRSIGDDRDEHTLPVTRTGCISSLAKVRHPAFVEARLRIANAVLASNVWMLSRDSTQEIDICEAYGGRGDDGRADWFSKRLHLSHHVFIRKPLQDYQPKDPSTWRVHPRQKPRRGESYWTDRYYRIGVHWKSPTHLDYYIDGELVKTTSGLDNQTLADGTEKGGIDPRGYTKNDRGERTGLSKPMHIIVNMEAQDWNAIAGRTPTDTEIRRTKDHTFLVDWVRVYRPAPAKESRRSRTR